MSDTESFFDFCNDDNDDSYLIKIECDDCKLTYEYNYDYSSKIISGNVHEYQNNNCNLENIRKKLDEIKFKIHKIEQNKIVTQRN